MVFRGHEQQFPHLDSFQHAHICPVLSLSDSMRALCQAQNDAESLLGVWKLALPTIGHEFAKQECVNPQDSVLICRVNKRGEPMLSSLNLTSHLHHDGVFY